MPGHQRIGLLILPILVFIGGQLTAQDGADSSRQPAETTSAEQQELTERDNLWEQARSLAKEGKTREAIDVGEQVLTLNRQLHGESSREVAVMLKWLTYRYFSVSDRVKTEEKATELLKTSESLNGKEHHETIDARWGLDYYKRMATVESSRRKEMQRLEADYRKFYSAARYPEAIAAARQLVPLEEQHLGKEHPYLANTLVGLATALLKAKQFADAEPVARRALDIRRKHLGDKHPNSARVAWQVSESLLRQKNYLKALEATTTERDLYLAIGQPASAAWAESARGRCLKALMRNDEAIAAYRASLVSFRKLKHARGEARQLRYLAALDDAVSLKDEHARMWSEARKARSAGRLSEAAAAGERMLALERDWLGEKHSAIGKSLEWLAAVYEDDRDWPNAEGKRREVLKRLTESLESKHWRVTDARLALADALHLQTLSPSQIKQLNEASQFGAQFKLSYQENELDEAIQDAIRVIAIRTHILGEVHQKTATSTTWLAYFHRLAKNYEKAETLYKQSLKVLQRALGEEHPRVATTLKSLGLLYREQGDYVRAEQFLQQCLAIRRKTLGEEHLDYASILEALGMLHKDIGKYGHALGLYTQCLAIRGKTQGTEHPDYATTLSSLGIVYRLMGNYARSESLLQQAVETTRKVVGVNDPSYAKTLNNLGTLYVTIGDYSKGESLLLEALEIMRQTLGKDNKTYATHVNNLGMLYRSMGDYGKAEPLLLESFEIRRHLVGEDHPFFATAANNLALLYRSMGEHEKVEPLFLKTLNVLGDSFGNKHPYYAMTLNDVGTFYWSKGEFAKAALSIGQSLKGSLHQINEASAEQSERQQLAICGMLRSRLDGYLSLSLQVPELRSVAAREVIRWKGTTLVKQRAMRRAAADPVIADQFRKLQLVTRQLSSLSRSSPGNDVEAWRGRLSGLTSQKEDLEAELSRRSTAFRSARERVSFEDIQRAIPKDGVLVDYLQYRRTRSVEQNGKGQYEASLLATVIQPVGEPLLVDLGPVAPVDAAVDAWRGSLGMSEGSNSAGRVLRAKIWEPLLEHVGDARTVLVSADGTLGRLPLSALPGKEAGSYLLEDHRLAMIPVPQLLPALIKETDRQGLSRELLLMGGVDYDADADDAAPVKRRRRRAARSDEKFARLPGTAGEVASIAETYRDIFEFDDDDITILKNAGATEARFRELAPQFYHLHLATHGFFASADKLSALSSEAIDEADRRSSAGRAMLATRDQTVVGLNPGLLSGLAFSGANREPQADQDDGILTAQEIAFLPLNGVDSVVLSACETGLGPVAGGEGLLGVQRAFQIAGARTTVASFWKVDDLVTRRLMERFYRNLWKEEMARLDALRDAQLWILNNPEAMRGATIGNSGENPQRVPPYYWAAFTLSGDWR